MRRIEIRTNKALPLIALPFSLFILGVGLWLEQKMQMATGGILLLVSILQLANPMVVVENEEIQLRNLFGMTLRRVPFKPADVTFDGLAVLVAGKKVIGSTWALGAAPLQELKSAILAEQARSGTV